MKFQKFTFPIKRFNIWHASGLSLVMHILFMTFISMPEAKIDVVEKKAIKKVRLEIVRKPEIKIPPKKVVKKLTPQKIVKKNVKVSKPKVTPKLIQKPETPVVRPAVIRNNQAMKITQVKAIPVQSKVIPALNFKSNPSPIRERIQNKKVLTITARPRQSITPVSDTKILVQSITQPRKNSSPSFTRINVSAQTPRINHDAFNYKNRVTHAVLPVRNTNQYSRIKVAARSISTEINSNQPLASSNAKAGLITSRSSVRSNFKKLAIRNVNQTNDAALITQPATFFAATRYQPDSNFRPVIRQVVAMEQAEEEFDNTLSEEEFQKIWGSFTNTVRQQIARAKNYPSSARKKGQEGKAFLKFKLDKDGSVANLSIVQSSGHNLLDEAAIRAIKEAAPYPPIPDELNRSYALLKLPISFILK